MKKNDNQPEKSLQFHITEKCNYKCEYCVQGKGDASAKNCEYKHASDRVIDAFLKLIYSLDDSFRINLTGGEAMLHPRFSEIIEKIGNTNHKFSFISNFSFPLEAYQEIVDKSSNSLTKISASLHLSQIKSLDDFIDKAIALAKYLKTNSKKTTLRVSLVLTEENYRMAINIAEKLKSHNMSLNLKHLKIDDKFVDYSPKIKAFIDSYNKSIPKIINLNPYGIVCYAGYQYYTIKHTGSVRRCYNHQGDYRLGNIAEGTFKPFDKPHPCYSQKCTCPVPVNRNLIRFGEYDWDMIREFEKEKKRLKRRAIKVIRKIAHHFPGLKHFIKKILQR